MTRTSIIALAIILLTACAHQPERKPVELQQALQSGSGSRGNIERPPLPESVRQSLRGDNDELREAGAQLLAEPRFSIAANGISAKDFFAGLAADSPYNIVVHPEVSGTITLSLKDVTLSETLDVVSDIYGFDVRKENRMIRVFPAGLRSETIALDYLALRRMGLSQTSVSSGGVKENDRNNSSGQYGGNANNNLLGNQGGANNTSQNMNGMQTNGSSISSSSETDLWNDLEAILTGIIGPGEGRRVVVAPRDRKSVV